MGMSIQDTELFLELEKHGDVVELRLSYDRERDDMTFYVHENGELVNEEFCYEWAFERFYKLFRKYTDDGYTLNV